ncbi:MAG TPA: hypothetical protein VKP69_02855 [Isosphaeraceae bacterium]|nr:hypothetical protein [Isosphaeraceae bacterium]
MEQGAAEKPTTGLVGGQGGFRPLADPAGLVLGDGGQHVDREPGGVEVVAGDEVQACHRDSEGDGL